MSENQRSIGKNSTARHFEIKSCFISIELFVCEKKCEKCDISTETKKNFRREHFRFQQPKNLGFFNYESQILLGKKRNFKRKFFNADFFKILLTISF